MSHAPEQSGPHHRPHPALIALTIGAIGVVFGDIGTSPLYAFREALNLAAADGMEASEILGVLSLALWSLTLVVTVKYVLFLMRADNQGEGGVLALTALARRALGKRSMIALTLGAAGAALFYGDAIITPALSVLSAIEGLRTIPGAAAMFDEQTIMGITIVILVGLFLIQSRGTARVSALFGPVCILWFFAIGGLGLWHIADEPAIIAVINPAYAIRFMASHGTVGLFVLGAVFLTVTGAEALTADMGHFGVLPIRIGWFLLAFPALMLNYLGQGAYALRTLEMTQAAHQPFTNQDWFFLLAPDALRPWLVVLAGLATIIASQAVITGAYSLTQQAIQLGFMPRLRITHTSSSAIGQIYIPVINWALMLMVILLVLSFRSSSNLAAAYGIAVTGAMFIDTILIGVVLISLWKWNPVLALALLAVFLVVDIAYFAANLTKVPDGGWFPLLVGFLIFTLLTTWAKGRHLMMARMHEAAMPLKVFIQSAATAATRVPGTAVFMTSSPEGVPHALLHNLKHNKVLHERIILLTVKVMDMPYYPDDGRCHLENLDQGFHRMVLKYGFMQEPDVPAALSRIDQCGAEFRMMDTSFFLSRQTLLASDRPGMMIWREKLFSWMLRNAESAMEFFRLPTNRVVELGSQVEI